MFSTKSQAVLLLVVTSFSFSAGLKCYFCEYIKDYSGENCKNPGDDLLFDVASYPGTTRSNQIAMRGQVSSIRTSVKGAGDDTKATVTLCQTLTGKLKGRDAISRVGGYGDASLAGTCKTESSGGATVTGCWCDTDGCNGDIDDGRGGRLYFVAFVTLGAIWVLVKLRA